MHEVTRKLQVTVPKALDLETRLRLFDQATERQRRRQREDPVPPADGDRGWTREEPYDRGARDCGMPPGPQRS